MQLALIKSPLEEIADADQFRYSGITWFLD
jgi:hypothetical protein